MDVKEADRSIDYEAWGEVLSNTFKYVDNVLAYNVINEKNCLIIVKVVCRWARAKQTQTMRNGDF